MNVNLGNKASQLKILNDRSGLQIQVIDVKLIFTNAQLRYCFCSVSLITENSRVEMLGINVVEEQVVEMKQL